MKMFLSSKLNLNFFNGVIFALLVQIYSMIGHSAYLKADEVLKASGSSTVYPLTTEAARRFERKNNGLDINVEFTGTTAGFKKFCAGEVDINNASRAINATEKAICNSNQIKYIEVPVAMDAISIVVNPANDWVNEISLSELKRLWSPESENEIVSWQDIRAEWPDEPIVLFGRGQDSGTYDYFTSQIVGSTRSSRMDYTASEDEEFLAAEIAAEPNALGFFGIGAYHRHWDSLKVLAITNKNNSVYPSLDTVKNGEYAPLSRPLYVYVNKNSIANTPELSKFIFSYLEGIRSWVHFTGFLPLDDNVYADSLNKIKQGVNDN